MRRRALILVSLLAAIGIAAAAPTSSSAALAPAKQQSLQVAVGYPSEGRTLDPARGSYTNTLEIQSALLLPLYAASATGIRPVLAAGQPTFSADRKVLTVKLRAAKWSDGMPIVAKDVVTALARARKLKAYHALMVSSIKSVTAPNARTVVFKLSYPDAVLPQLLSLPVFTPVPTHLISKRKEQWTKPGWMVSSGPFVLASATNKELRLVRNAKFFGAGKVRLQKLTFVTTNGASARALSAGTVQAVLPGVLSPAETQAASTSGNTTASVTSVEAQYAYFNTTNSKLSKSQVRRGIALALDRAAITAVTGGQPISTILPPTMPGGSKITSQPHLLNSDGSANAAAATAALSAAAWVPGTTLNLVYSTESRLAGKMAELMKSQLAPFGVVLELKPISGKKMNSVGYGISPAKAEVDILLQGWYPDSFDPIDFYALFVCDNVKAGFNVSNLCDTSYDSSIVDVWRQFNFVSRLSAYTRLEQHLTSVDGSMPAAPLYAPALNTAAKSWVGGYKTDAFGTVAWDKIAISKH